MLIHVFEVLISGVFNQLRGMITGYYRIDSGEVDTGRIHPVEVDSARIHTDMANEAKPDEPAATEEPPHD